ncbi:MAG: cytochrome c oxidase subunit II [Pseudorhodobacter sp.]|nr:cytochrome c oxidase subunit II [Pseudorhodobacter sp.]
MRLLTTLSGFTAGLTGLMLCGAALAQDVPIVGQPVDKAMGFQAAGTNLARDLQALDLMILIIISAITILVSVLLLWVALRYNRRANPKPATFTHNSPLEIAWTIVPILILVVIGSFSLPVLFKQLEIPGADVTVKVTGNQWFWSYEYPDEDIAFDSFLIGDGKVMTPDVEAELVAAGYGKSDFLLATDTAMVVPVNKTIVVQLTGSDVIHAWMVPSLGMQMSAVPGRLAETWFKAEVEGTYFGQCSTLCGKDHSFMPITVKVVSQAVYDDWLAETKLADAGAVAPMQVALAD